MTELKPCPFCGGGTKVFKRIDRDKEQSLYLYWIDCSNRECGVQFPLGERSEESAIEKWNTRTAPVVIHADPEPEEPIWKGRKCTWTENDDGAWETSCEQMFEFTTAGPTSNKFIFCPYCGKRIEAEPKTEPQGKP
jgi:Lar family restriction alleviation protein